MNLACGAVSLATVLFVARLSAEPTTQPLSATDSGHFTDPPAEQAQPTELRIDNVRDVGNLAGVGFLDDGLTRFEVGGSLNSDAAGHRTGTFYLGLREVDSESPAKKSTLKGEGFPVHSAAVTPDGRRAVFSMLDWDKGGAHFLRVGDLTGPDAGTSTPLHRHANWCEGIAISADGKFAATSYLAEKTIDLWDLDAKKILRTFDAGATVGILAFDRTGKHLIAGVSGTGDCDVQVWNLDDGAKTVRKGATSRITSLAVSRDGLFVASADADGAVWLWLLSDSSPRWRRQMPLGESVQKLAFSPDGQWLLVGSDKAPPASGEVKGNDRLVEIRFFDATTGQGLARYEQAGSPVRAATFSPDGKMVLTDQAIAARAWAVPDLRERAEASPATLPSAAATRPSEGQLAVMDVKEDGGGGGAVAFSADGATVYHGGFKGVSTWSVVASRRTARFPTSGPALMIRPEFDLAVVSSYHDQTGFVDLHRLSTGERIARIGDETLPYVDAVALSPDATRLVIAAGTRAGRVSPVFKPELSLWDAKAGTLLWRIATDTDNLQCLAFTHDGGQVLVGAGSKSKERFAACEIRRLDAKTGKRVGLLKADADRPINAFAVTPDGRRIWGTGNVGPLVCWDAATGDIIRKVNTLPTDGPYSDTSPLAVSPDGKRLAVGLADSNILLIDAETGKVTRKLTSHEQMITSLTFSPDGKRLLSASADKTERLWDLGNAEHP